MANTTKEDRERKALEEIVCILDALGDDSHLGAAFEGCLEDAKIGIETGVVCSMKQRLKHEQQRRVAAEREAQDLVRKLKASVQAEETARARATDLETECGKLRDRIAELVEDRQSRGDSYTELRRELRETRYRTEAAEADVILLKAKLYDYLTAGE